MSYRPVVDVDMLIRRPPADVYEAFAEPEQIRQFWLAQSSGPCRTGARITWTFKIAGAVTEVEVVEAVPNQVLDLRWDDGRPLRIELEDRGEATLVHILETGFGGDTPSADAIESMSGFTLVLASLNAWLEHGIEGDLVYEKFPDAKYSDR